jgi:hypothetical protein
MDARPQLLSARARPVVRSLTVAWVLLGAGCSTQVRTDRPDARIYRDGEYLGTGTATTSSTGLPGEVVFVVEADGQRRENPVSREFRTSTFFVGLFTYMTGWFWCWQLPAEVSLLAPERSTVSRWQRSDGQVNPWRRAVAETATAPESAPAAPAPESAAPVPAAPGSAPAAPAPESAAPPAAPGSTPWRSAP